MISNQVGSIGKTATLGQFLGEERQRRGHKSDTERKSKIGISHWEKVPNHITKKDKNYGLSCKM